MSDQKTPEATEPAPQPAKPEGEAQKVDTGVQERAAEEREESGGYD